MVKKISKKLAILLGNKLDVDKNKIDIYAYGLEIILCVGIKLILIILASLVLGIFKTTIVSLITYILFRIYGGGVHLSTYLRCLSVGIVIFLSLGKLSLLDIQTEILIIFMIITFILGVITIIKWVPAGTEKKRIIDKDLIINQKKKESIILILWVLSLLLTKFQLKAYSFAAILGAFTSFFLMTPLGYWVMYTHDNILNRFRKGVTDNVKKA